MSEFTAEEQLKAREAAEKSDVYFIDRAGQLASRLYDVKRKGNGALGGLVAGDLFFLDLRISPERTLAAMCARILVELGTMPGDDYEVVKLQIRQIERGDKPQDAPEG